MIDGTRRVASTQPASSAHDRHSRLLDRISGERVAPYSRIAQGHGRNTLAYYHWNTQLAAAYLELLSVAEVVFRNTVNEQLREWCRVRTGEDVWLTSNTALPYPLDKLFESVRQGAMSRARDAKTVRDSTPGHERTGSPLTEGDLLSQVTFGQWHGLFPYKEGAAADPTTNGYRLRIWGEALHTAFPPDVNPGDVRWLLFRLTYFRNRVAHHECIISPPLPPDRRHPLRARLRDVFTLLRWIDPGIHEWASGSNRVSGLLNTGAATLEIPKPSSEGMPPVLPPTSK
ncbi:hypothetical protein GOEFS_036_00330 [Gordonia effusa NBRC 100432]|uniref:Abi-like protein n=1 Tax=Gordonia effusa NBRC 100432 TaxID=1077974 RepID=H0QXP3_9ACTN|nr:hypothetical protein GOEFS_036_00330 [Gordonia effusa NBRC 100432]